MNRFKMEFSNSRNAQLNYLENMLQLKGGNKSTAIIPAMNIPLNSPMINRIHTAKPGCSACGKKVA
jgi:hypothetical protein